MNPEAILNLSKVNRNVNKFNALQALLLIMKTSKLHINFIVLRFSLFELYYWCVTTVLSTKPKALLCLQNLLHKFDRPFADGSKLFLPAPKSSSMLQASKYPTPFFLTGCLLSLDVDIFRCWRKVWSAQHHSAATFAH